MKIGVISDTHIPARAKRLPEQLLSALKGVDRIIHAGDVLNLPTLKELESIAETTAVRGNMDYPEIQKLLPEKVVLEMEGYRIGMTHGIGSPHFLGRRLLKRFENDNIDVLVFGHSHVPLSEKEGEVLLFNPGSPTDMLFSPFRSYGIITLGQTLEADIIVLE